MPDAVRLARPDELPLLAAIHASAFDPRQAWSAEAIDGQLRVIGTLALIHDAGGMALVRFVVDEAEILTLAVRPAARRHGVGRALMQTAMQLAQMRKVNAVYLEVSEANAPARRLYTALGFQESGIRRRYYDDGSDAIAMTAVPAAD